MRHVIIFFILIIPLFAYSQAENQNNQNNSEDIITLPPIEVKTERIEKKPRFTMKGDRLNSATGTGGDALRALDELPSVGVLNDFVGILSVRGGGPEDNLYYFDRLPLGYPYHLYGIVSTVNADVIQNIEVYPGGYGAEFGSDSQAVIDINSRSKTESRLDGKINLNPVYTQAFLDGKIGNRGYWYVFGRRSYMETLFELLPRLLEIENDLVTQVPRFWSYQGKAVYQLTKSHRLVINAIAADDSAEFRFGADEVSESDLRGPLKSDNPFDSQGIHFYSEKEDVYKSIFSLTRSFSRTQLEFGEGYSFRNSDDVTSLRADLQYWIKYPKSKLETGMLLSSNPSSIDSIGSRPFEEGDWDYNVRLKKDGEKVDTYTTQTIHRFESYLQSTQDLFTSSYAALYTSLGIRATYFNLIDSFSLQPRGLLGVTLGPEEVISYGISLFPLDLQFMYGNYVQNPQLYQIVLGENNPDISPTSANHYVVSIEKYVTPETRVDVAGYYKTLHNMITFNLTDKTYKNQRTGSVKGIEVSIEHEIGDTLRGWFAYSYTVSKRQDSHKDEEREYMYSTPHVLTINLNYLLDSIELGANWQYKSGVLYSPLDGREWYVNPHTDNETWIPIYGEPKRTEPYHRLDLRFHWIFINIDNFKGGLTLELWNAYNRTNLLQVRYNSDYSKEVPIAQLPIVPFLAVSIEF